MITLSKWEFIAVLTLLGIWFVAYGLMERDYTMMKRTLELANARLPCEEIPKSADGGVVKYRYDPIRGKLIDIRTGEIK